MKNVEVNDGDELSLHWNLNEKGQGLESEVESFSDPVVRFRFARQSNAEDPMIISSSNHNPVAAKGDEHPVHSPKIKLEDEIQNNDETAISNKPSSVVATVLKNESITNIQPLRDLDMKVEAIGSSLKLSEGHFHDESVSNKNLVKLNTNNLDLEKHSNVNEGDKTDTDNNDNNCQRDNEQNKCKSGVETTQHDCDISVKNDVTNIDAVESDSNTEEEESEPLTLPNQFFTSSSFDSPQRSTEHLKISEKNHYVDHATTEIVKKEINECCSSVTPLKRNLPDKMKPMDIEYGECNNFPIENNDPKCLGTSASISLMKEKRDENDTSTLVPLATLTRDQLKQLHRETNSARLNPSETPAPDCTLPSQALRYAVLSLTLALTSDASSWDANFLRDDTDVLHKNEAKKQKMNQLQSPMGANQKGVQQWMPRLLQGTTVVMRKTLS